MTNTTPSVLYVEDDPQSRWVLEMLLSNRMKLPNVTILESSHNFASHLTAVNPPPDVIFLDINVYPYDGYAMLDMIRRSSKFQKTPVVALTASVMNEEVQRLKNAGFDGVIAKPINLTTFPDTLQRILNGETIWHIID